ncbi:Uma2 family endonuclease [Pseudanabaena catenata USMAC16]|uniref:Uma2 family endonuclease n=2 Tax=Pseudanabaena TaxID=1152 RepID=A0A9X4MBH1_9CYAN|nr:MULTISPECIES: Uma2 family endonuclease [Pseudanabaena]MDG3496120.1 Uma2 family endonuclease [Pseudanabaena catenata USMAC16]
MIDLVIDLLRGSFMAIAIQPKPIQPNLIALEDFLVLPETEPASEYINGNIYQKPMPQGKHSTLQGKLVAKINQLGEPEQILFAFPELRCTFAGRSIVPDIAVFEWEHIPLDANGEIINRIEIPPDWIVEILSPEQSSIDVIDKISFALKNGTKLGWLIAPQERTVLSFQGDRFYSHRGEDLLPVLEGLEGWQVSVNDLFDLLSFAKR